MKQTALDYLFEKIIYKESNPYLDKIYKEAKEMEKIQAINDFNSGYNLGEIKFNMTGEQYYNINYLEK